MENKKPEYFNYFVTDPVTHKNYEFTNEKDFYDFLAKYYKFALNGQEVSVQEFVKTLADARIAEDQKLYADGPATSQEQAEFDSLNNIAGDLLPEVNTSVNGFVVFDITDDVKCKIELNQDL